MGRAAPVNPTRGVAAGCSFAKALVHLYYREDLDKFVATHEGVCLDVYIDDITMSVQGHGEAQVAAKLHTAG